LYNAYGRNVYKKYQVNIGNPYQIKSKKMPSAGKAAVSGPETSPREEAEEILENARLEAEKIISKASEEANRILEDVRIKAADFILEAEQQAKEEGYKNGETLARQHYQSLIDEAEALRQRAREVLENTVSGLEEEMVDTVLEIGKKVIGMELSQNRDVIFGLIRTALLDSSLSDEVIVHVSPEDYEYVEENREKLMADGSITRNIKIIEDCGMKKGECYVETEYGTVDSSIETQFENIERLFRELLGNNILPE
jgi:flagellar assembly protein FliH